MLGVLHRQACLSCLTFFATTGANDWLPTGFPEPNTVAEILVLRAPRTGFEPAASCLGGIPPTSPDVAGYGLMWRSAAPTVAGRGPASPSVCRRWLGGSL